MQKSIIKWFSPLLYAGFLVPAALVIIIFTATLVGRGGYLFELHGWAEVLLAIVTAGSLIFWFANKILIKIEKTEYLTVFDHYRQSVVCYGLALVTSTTLFLNGGFHGGLGEGIQVVAFLIAMWAIFSNAFYLYWFSRTPRLINPSAVVKPPSAKIGLSIFIGPAVILLLMIVGYYVRQRYLRIQYFGTPSNGIAPPGTPLPPMPTNLPPTSSAINF